LLGTSVGDAVGDWLTLGDALGTCVGDRVGPLVGDLVGFRVGLSVGDALGLAIGLTVGDGVGLAVGLLVGVTLGNVQALSNSWQIAEGLLNIPSQSSFVATSVFKQAIFSPPSHAVPSAS